MLGSSLFSCSLFSPKDLLRIPEVQHKVMWFMPVISSTTSEDTDLPNGTSLDWVIVTAGSIYSSSDLDVVFTFSYVQCEPTSGQL
ncbi:hypothetical protein J6590_053260 [Homalodisca vitripennis]|nr:hypothetical protein J6590_053260 [Homalodisca vitripennis]